MKKIISIIIFISFICIATYVSINNKSSNDTSIKVGVISGPEAELVETAKIVAKRYNLDIKIIEFSDYMMPNQALIDGSIDANVFQHEPYLTARYSNNDLKVIGKTFIYPVGIYSKSITNLLDIKDGSRVGIPNDPSNEARALLLLEKANLIKLRQGVTTNAMPIDIVENPKNLSFIELSAAELPRRLDDLDIGILNANYAIPAKLIPSIDAIFLEGTESKYANVIVIKSSNEQIDNKYRILVKSLNSKEVLDRAKDLFKDQAIPAFTIDKEN